MSSAARGHGAEGLHVLRLTPYYFFDGRPPSRRDLQYEAVGGMQVQIAQTTEEVDRLGIRQTVVLPRRPGFPRLLRPTARTVLRLLRLPVTPIRTRSKGYAGLLVSWGVSLLAWCLACRLRRREKAFSVIHLHCSELPWTFVFGLLAAALLRRPLVLTTHCSATATFDPETLAGRLLIGPARMAERAAVRRADCVVVLTDRIRQAYLESGLTHQDRIAVVPDGVRTRQFPPAPEVVSDKPPIVLYCGRFAPEKGWIDFVLAARLLVGRGAHARFVMCGDGNELRVCRREVTRQGLAGSVVLPGHLGRDEVAALMRRSAVVVVPSRHEELGGTVLEAMSTGRPLVVTAVGALPELVGDSATGLVVPAASPGAIAEAILRLLRDPSLRDRLGREGSVRAKSYEAALVARQLVDVYRRVGGAG